jgi:putative transposase
MKSKYIIQQKYKNVTCPKCNSSQIKKDGKRKTNNWGKIQRHRCKDCNFRFVIDDGFYRMRNHPNKITVGIDLYYKGVSLRKVQEHFQAFYPHNSSHMSVYYWIVKYAEMVRKLVDNIPIRCGNEMQSNEMEYYRRKSKYPKGKEQNWFVDTFDVETKFMVTGEYMKSRTYEKLIKVMKRAKFKTGEQVEIVTTNGLRVYPKVLRKTFSLQSPYHAS